MIRATTRKLQSEAAIRFGLTAVDSDMFPRDVIWCPADIALRKRAEQSAALGRAPEQHFPFISFWRTGWIRQLGRYNAGVAIRGVSIDDSLASYYKMKPIELTYQFEFWAKDEEIFEAAVETWLDWSMPGAVLVLTDSNNVTFDLGLKFLEPQDNSYILRMFDIGEIHRATFALAVSSYLVSGVEEPGAIIDEIEWSFRDSSAVEDLADAPVIKTGLVHEAIYYDTGETYDSGEHYDP